MNSFVKILFFNMFLFICVTYSMGGAPSQLDRVMTMQKKVERAKTIKPSNFVQPNASKNERYTIGFVGLKNTLELINNVGNPGYVPRDEVLQSFLTSYVLADRVRKNPHNPALLKLGVRPDQPENGAVIDNGTMTQVIYKPSTDEFTGIRLSPKGPPIIVHVSLSKIINAYNQLIANARPKEKNTQAYPVNLLAWTQKVADVVNIYFKKPYKNDPKRANQWRVGGKTYIVYRPNHSLAHGVRQGLFAVDIIEGLLAASSVTSPEAKLFKDWLKNKIATDPYFKHKVEIASAFQRTGRGSEDSSTTNEKLYKQYERQDVLNFEKDMRQHVGPGKLFRNELEFQTYKEAIMWSTVDEGKLNPTTNQDLLYLRKIFHAAHHLDLRRMTDFSPEITKSSAMIELFGNNSVLDVRTFSVNPDFIAEQDLINKLWERSGEYMDATGDRDNSSIPKRINREERFGILAHNPQEMVKKLVEKRSSSPIQF